MEQTDNWREKGREEGREGKEKERALSIPFKSGD